MTLQNLPPEMQERIAAIMAGGAPDQSPHQAAMAQQPLQPPQPAIVKSPSLMDHVVGLRQEVATLQQQNAAVLQTLEAVGQAVASLYEMFQPTQQQTYSNAFVQQTQQDQEDF